MIPELVDGGGPWKVLPPGVHDATLDEVRAYFATTPRRRALLRGLSRACKSLAAAGCSTVYLDGSFITDKPIPGDFDVCWDSTNVNVDRLDPVFLDFTNGRAHQKSQFGGEFFPSSARADGSHTFLEYFQIDKETGSPKGIVRIDLSHERDGKKHDNERKTIQDYE